MSSKESKKEPKKLTQDQIHETDIKVYDKMQAVNKLEGKWVKEGAVLQNTCKVYEGFTKNHNMNFAVSGSFYVLNKEKNKEYQAAVKEKRAKMEADAKALEEPTTEK